jgi:hypothetical protein
MSPFDATGDTAARTLIERYIRALHEQDFDTLGASQHPEFVEDYPQSGERIRGRADWRWILQNYPGGLTGPADASADTVVGGEDRWLIAPTFTMVRVSGAGDMQTATVRLRYPDGSTWYMISMIELRDGLIAKATTYFAPMFDAPDWRKAHVGTIPGWTPEGG